MMLMRITLSHQLAVPRKLNRLKQPLQYIIQVIIVDDLLERPMPFPMTCKPKNLIDPSIEIPDTVLMRKRSSFLLALVQISAIPTLRSYAILVRIDPKLQFLHHLKQPLHIISDQGCNASLFINMSILKKL